MDVFTHALASLTIARTAHTRLPRFGTSALVVAGIAPDLDYVSYFAGPAAFLAYHRTALHSIPGATITSCALAALFCLLDKKLPPRNRTKHKSSPLTFATGFAVCAAGAIGHQLLDLASGEGIQLLWPFRIHWSRWNLAANFDPWIVILLLAGLLVPQLFRLVGDEVGARKKRASGGRAAIATLVILISYFGARAYLHGRALGLLLSSEYHGREPASAGAFPSSANPFAWRGVVSTDNTLEELELNLSASADFNPDRGLTHYKPADSPALEAGEKAVDAQKFLRYAQFPLANVARREGGYRFELHDVSFPAGDDSPANMFVRVDLSSSAQIVREEIRYASSAEN